MSRQPRDFNSPKYKWWRRKVFQRDGYRCQFPGCAGTCKELEAHHIVRVAYCPRMEHFPGNGVTLCVDHHHLVTGQEKEYEATFKAIVSAKSGEGALKVMLMKNALRKQEP